MTEKYQGQQKYLKKDTQLKHQIFCYHNHIQLGTQTITYVNLKKRQKN
jgi:hypothetical protein